MYSSVQEGGKGTGMAAQMPKGSRLVKAATAAAAILAGLSGSPFTATASDLPQAWNDPPLAAASPWTWTIGAYAFVPLSVEGSSTVNGGTVNLDLGPSEIFDLLEFAISGRVEGWRETDAGDGSAFGVVFDGQYVNLGAEIGGIGPARKRALLNHFGSAKAVSRASLADLEAVPTISKAMAQMVYDHFNRT
mgnify:CR=1 FL=1